MPRARRCLARVSLFLLAWQLGIFASSPVIISCHGRPAGATMACCNGEHEGAACPMHKQQAPDTVWRSGCGGGDVLASLFGLCGVLARPAVFHPLFAALGAAPDIAPSDTSFLPLRNVPPPRA